MDVSIYKYSKFQIRAATSADFSDIAQIIAESFHSQKGLWSLTFPLFRLGIYEDLRYRLSSMTPRQVCLVAVDTSLNGNNKVLATIEISLRFRDNWTNVRQCFPYLSNLAVHPQYRRYGLASSLLLSCEQICLDWGFKDLYLHVLENNHQARQLYCKLGYRVQKFEYQWHSFFFHSSRQIFLHKHLSQVAG
jgi:ribosomal protein S18 acetylase RimI-like enzyme